MADEITDRPPFEVPPNFRKARRWAQRKVPDGYSDGDRRHWPGRPLYKPSPEEYYLCVLGQHWAEKDGIAQPGVQYHLDKLPDGYAMFEQPQPGGPQTYRRLFGHPSGRFYDSAARFVPHFLWLMSGMEGDCECIYCTKGNKQVVHRQTRAPREAIDKTLFNSLRTLRDVTDDDEDNDSSRSSSAAGGIAMRRGQRQVRQPGAPPAVDEEGTEDIYKDCVKKLENAKDATRGVEVDLTEDGSIDWKAERESLPQYLTQIEQQHSFIPRIGELVLWCPDFLDDHYLMFDLETSEYKFYSFRQKCFHGFPAWRGGVVTAVPSASLKNGPVDFPDILDTPKKKTSFNTAGFRIETMPDPNDDMDKSMSKQYRYVPLRNIRPLTHWQLLLKRVPEDRLHSSIQHALTCMTSVSLVEKWRFNGSWPNGRIFCKGIHLGSELIIVGDTIRLMPSKSVDQPQPDVLVVESIRYNMLKMQPEHSRPDTPQLCSSSYIAFVGAAFTVDRSKLIKFRSLDGVRQEDVVHPLKTSEVKTLFRSVGAEEYGQWYPWHGPQQKYEVSHEMVMGRLYEADAVNLWTGQKQIAAPASYRSRPSLDFDRLSILTGRRYATDTDARLPEPQPNAINWFFADTRAQALALSAINGMDVGRYHDVRTPPTLKQWRMQVKVADGQPIAPEIADEYIRDLSQVQLYTGARRGRPAGSKMVDGKLVVPGRHRARDKSDHIEQMKHKPSSQLAGAALVTDHDSSEGYYSDGMDSFGADETSNDPEPKRDLQKPSQVGSGLSKVDIMSSVEVPSDGVFEDDFVDDIWDIPPARGGTEESEGGDYRE